MTKSLRTRDRGGYSTVEIVMVLVLIGIIATLSGPAMSSYLARDRARLALDQLASDVAYARMAAVRSGGRARLRFEGASSYHIERPGSDPVRVRTVLLGQEYAGVVVLPPSGSLEFNSRGLLVTDPGAGYIVVSSGETRDSLMITPAGRLYRDH